MKSSAHVKSYPRFFKFLPISNYGCNFILTNDIYVNSEIYADLKNEKPNHFSVAVLRHEIVHAQNASVKKFLKFMIFKNFRLKEEIAAYRQMFKYLKLHKQTIDLDRIVRDFSGIRYLWMCSYTDAKILVYRLWQEI